MLSLLTHSLALVLVDLLTNGMSDRRDELTPKPEVSAETACEFLGRVGWIIDIPLELVAEDVAIESDIELDESDELASDWLEGLISIHLSLDFINDMSLEWLRHIELLSYHFSEYLSRKVRLVLIEAKPLLI